MNIYLEHYGTDKIGIAYRLKMGSGSISSPPVYPPLTRYPDEYKVGINKNIIVMIRDVLDFWKSCYYERLAVELTDRNHQNFLDLMYSGTLNTFVNTSPVVQLGLDQIAELHTTEKDKNHICVPPAFPYGDGSIVAFWEWVTYLLQPDIGCHRETFSLKNLFQHSNVYFLELKDLSNPKFLEWLHEKDKKWKAVKEFPHKHKTPNKLKLSMDLFWKEYKEGKILKDKVLASPFYDLPGNDLRPEFPILQERLEQEQKEVDNIRENSERYLRI